MNWVKEYHRQIEAGEVVVSAKVRKVYSKLAADIDMPRGDWVFDEEAGERPIEFIETFCRQSKGEWIGQPVVLDVWQKAFVQAMFGFVHKDTGERRFKEVLLLVARKNGKSTLLSGIALYMLMADGEGGAEVYSVATKKDQARIVFSESVNMVKQSPGLSRHLKKRKTDLYFGLTFSKYEPLASDSNTLDGLNSSCVIIDELHAIKNRDLYDVMKRSTSARRQPLVVMITTSGTVRECIYDEMYDYAVKVLDGLVEDDRFLPVLYELDDRSEWTDWRMWAKANPGLGTIKKLAYLTENVELAKNRPDELSTTLCKDFNVRDTPAGSWLSFEDVNNEATFALEEIKDCYAIGGADLSSTTDLASATLLVMQPDKEHPGVFKRYIHQMYWLPRELLERRVIEDKIPYDKWRDRGFLRLCDGNKVLYSDVTAWFTEMVREHGIRPLWIGYDPWNSAYWIEEMKGLGFEMFEVRQGYKTLSQPMKELEGDLKAHLLNYGNNPILKWCLTNVSVKRDENGNIRPIKGKNQRLRIDGAVSLLITYVVLHEHMHDYKTLIG